MLKSFLKWLAILSIGSLSAQIVPIDSLQGYRDSSPYVNQTVSTVGIVTATVQDWTRYIRGFFIQDAEAPWHGIFVYTGNLIINVERGDSVQVTGRVTEYYGLTEISPSSASDITVLKKGARIPRPLKISASSVNTEPYEGVLIRIDSVTVTNNNLGNYQFEIRDPQGGTTIVQNCAGFSYSPQVGDFIPSIIGVDYYSYSAFKIVPRRDEDIVFTGNGTGYFYFENNIIATSEEKEVILRAEASAPFTISKVKIAIPSSFDINGDVIIGGPAFSEATWNLSNDTLLIENAKISPDTTGFIQFTKLYAPSNPGVYAFEVYTSDSNNFSRNPDPPKLNVVSIVGGGSASLVPNIVPLGIAGQISIKINNNFGTLRAIKVILPSNLYQWNSNLTLSGLGFQTATYQIVGDTIKIDSATIDSLRNGEIVLNNFAFIEEGLFQLNIYTGLTDSVALIQNPPKIFVASPDSTIKMKYFHIDSTKNFLMGQSVLVKGVVSGVIGDRTYIQDSTGGLIVYRGPSVAENTIVKLQGQFSEYRNSSQLYSAQLISSYGTGHLDTTTITLPPTENNEGMLVKVENLLPPSGVTHFIPDSSLVFTDSLNHQYRINVSSTSDLAYKPIPQGEMDIVGCVYQFDSYYNIQPRRTRDITAKGNGTGIFTLNPPYTYYGQKKDIDLLISSPFAYISSLEIQFTGASIDTFYLIGSGFVAPVIDSFYKDSMTTYLKISGGIELTSDTIRFTGFKPADSIESIAFSIKTSVDSGGYLAPVLNQPVLYVATPIGYVRQNGEDGYTPAFLNQNFNVVGIVTAPPRIFSTSRTSMYIQDETGGINVYYSGGFIDFNVGELVRVKGTILQYNGLTEISPALSTDLVRLGSGYDVEPLKLAEGRSLNESLEGMLITVEGTIANKPYASGSGMAFTLYNGMPPIDIYVYNTTGIDLSSVTPGSVYRIAGIVGQYDATTPYSSGYQLLPRFQEDIELLTPAESFPDVAISATPKIFSPYLGEALTIEVSVPLGTLYNLKIYNSAGRLVKTLASAKNTPQVFQWRGVDERENIMPPGLYILLLEYTKPDGTNGKIQKAIVLSRPK
ncbi:MAG: hypothetical protein QMD82_06840 [bacterium]|nr:hypothetical protein [bacterium]